ncbi:MAG: LysE type translocator [Chlorobi bacterium OLB5]|nr:MAG: LysE type translocator [Chlorobi bacterium OLB5]
MILTLIAGIITGFIVSIPPLGPIAFALISKGFRNEVKEGMAIASGSAFMDMIYALIAFGGISLFISLLPESAEAVVKNNSNIIQIILTYAGCVVVIVYGLRIMRTKIDLKKI